MKITLFLRNSQGKSIENITYNLKKNLPNNVNTEIYKLKHPNKGIINKIKNILDVPFHQGDVNHVTGDVHYITFLLNKKKTILTIHDCEKLVSKYYGFIKRKIYKLFWFTIPKIRCSIITTISKSSKNDLIKYGRINQKKIVVIPNGVSASFNDLRLSKQEKQKLLNNPNSKKTILHVGKEKPNKNIPRLINAISDLNLKFIKVGKITEKTRKLLEKNNIDYVQYNNISENFLCKLYNSVDCMVFPSLVEGFGLPLIESQKCDCPVITSNRSSIPEIAGEGAYYIDPFYSENIKNGIKKVIDDKKLKKKLVKKGFENTKRFNWKNIADQYYKLYVRMRK